MGLMDEVKEKKLHLKTNESGKQNMRVGMLFLFLHKIVYINLFLILALHKHLKWLQKPEALFDLPLFA